MKKIMVLFAVAAALALAACSNSSDAPIIPAATPEATGGSGGGTGSGAGTGTDSGGEGGTQTTTQPGAGGGETPTTPGGTDASASAVTTATPLTLEAISSTATVTFVNKAAGAVTYKVNGGDSQTIASGETKEISLAKAGDKVSFYGDNSAYAKQVGQASWEFDSYECSNISCSADCYIYGNIMSLVKTNDFSNLTTIPETKAFVGLFSGNIHIKNKNGAALLLPATTLHYDCYRFLFKGCSGLTVAPDLPATTLIVGCYTNMFDGCSSLVSAPALPATSLPDACYQDMFNGCASLTAAPELPAKTLSGWCYAGMFNGCKSLISAPALPAETLAKEYYKAMFAGCTSLTAAPALPATTLANNCYEGMFNRCEKLATAPTILPATTLTKECYKAMFYGCTSLTTAPMLPAATLEYNSYNYMFSGCSNLSSVTCLATTIISDIYLYCYGWLNGVAANGTFKKAASMNAWPTGGDGIPNGWTTEDYQASSGEEKYAMVGSKECKNLAETIASIASSTGDITVTLYGKVTADDLGKYDAEGKIMKAIAGVESPRNVALVFAQDANIALNADSSEVFANCPCLTTLDLRGLNTQNVTNMSSMFKGCVATTLDLSKFNTSKVVDMRAMFSGCKATALDLSGFDTSSVTNMAYMFQYCSGLTSVNLSGFNTSNVTNMTSMFHYCGVETLDLSSFDTKRVEKMENMFRAETVGSYCKKLKTIYASESFVTTAVTEECNGMFAYCDSLAGGAGTKHSEAGVNDKSYARIDKAGTPGYFTKR